MKYWSLKYWSLITLLVATSGVASADVIRVSPGGSPSTIQAAVDAALDGDLILVETGIYPSFVIRNIELTVVADTGADVKIDGAIRVGGVAATRTVVISGLKSRGMPVTNTESMYGLRVVNCSGLVFAQDCEFAGAPPSGPNVASRSSLLVDNSLAVVLANCVVSGGASQTDGLGYTGAPAPEGGRLTNSSVALYQTQIRGGNGGFGYQDGFHGAAGFVAIASQVFASDCTFVGGNGANGNDDGDGGNGGSGLSVLQGTSFVGFGVSFSGGSGGLAGACHSPFGCPHNGFAGSPSTQSGATIALLTGSARKLSAPALVRERQRATLAFQGSVNDTLVRMSSWHGHALLLAGMGTQVPVEDATFVKSTLGVLGASGALTQTIPIVELGAHVSSRVVFFQASHIVGGSVLRFGTPRAVIMLDSAY